MSRFDTISKIKIQYPSQHRLHNIAFSRTLATLHIEMDLHDNDINDGNNTNDMNDTNDNHNNNAGHLAYMQHCILLHRNSTNIFSRYCNCLRKHRTELYKRTTRIKNGERIIVYSLLDATTICDFVSYVFSQTEEERLSAMLRLYPQSKVQREYMNICDIVPPHIRLQALSYEIEDVNTFIVSIANNQSIMRKKICNGFLRLTVLLVRARRRAADRLYCPGGTGYEQCREEFYNHATIIRSKSRMHQR